MLSKPTCTVIAVLILAGCSGSLHAQTTGKKKIAARVSKLMFATFPPGSLSGAADTAIANSTSEIQGSVVRAITQKIDEDAALTPEQKALGRERLPEFSKRVTEKLKELAFKDFNIAKWMEDGFTENLNVALTLAELQRAQRFLESPAGKTYISELGRSMAATGPSADPGPADPPYFRTPAGKKLLAAWADHSRADERLKAWSTDMQVSLRDAVRSGEIARMTKEFRASLIK